ncbi:MAG: hypothetical protein ACU0CI_01580, partial [Shimia sp.]
SDSEWFGGQMGLVLENTAACNPIPAPGALGYFVWEAGGSLAPVKPWMRSYDAPGGDTQTLDLFPDLAPTFEQTPTRPSRRKPG